MWLLFFVLTLFLHSHLPARGNSVYQWLIKNNSLSLKWPTTTELHNSTTEPKPTPITVPSQTSLPDFVSFAYQPLSTAPAVEDNNDLPAAVLQLDRQALFYLPAANLQHLPLSFALHIKELSQEQRQLFPIINSNYLLSSQQTLLSHWQYLAGLMPEVNQDILSDLLIVQEKSGLYTILFSLQQFKEQAVKIFLACLNSEQNQEFALQLQKQDDFLYPDLTFSNFWPNHQGQLIFQQQLPPCQSQLWAVYSQNQSALPSTLSIASQTIAVEELHVEGR